MLFFSIFIHPVHSKKVGIVLVKCLVLTYVWYINMYLEIWTWKLIKITLHKHNHTHPVLFPRPASEYSSPSGRPLSCVVDENTPVMTPVNGAEASCPPGEPRVQERRVRSQRHRNYMSRTHLHTPPDLPEGYGERHSSNTHTRTPRCFL